MATDHELSNLTIDEQINHWVVVYEEWTVKHPGCGLDEFLGEFKLDSPLSDELRKLEHTMANLDLTIQNLSSEGNSAGLGIQPGDSIGNYEVVRLLGRGGMGQVWLANQKQVADRQVAIKLVNFAPQQLHFEDRLQREANVLSRLSHPNVARILDVGLHKEHPYLVLEYISGESLVDYCNANKLTTAERLDLFLQTCRGIQHAHQNGILHRDIKPANVMITEVDGQPTAKVIDFGLAYLLDDDKSPELTTNVLGVGSPLWMSPEHVRGRVFNEIQGLLRVDTRSDVYSMGCLLYQLLSGSTPIPLETFKQLTVRELLAKIEEEIPESPSSRASKDGDRIQSYSGQEDAQIATELDWITLRALEKEPGRRYQAVAEMANDIERFRDGFPVEASPPSTWYRLKKFTQRNKLIVGLTGTILFLLFASSILFASLAIWALDQRDIAQQAELKADFERNKAKESADVAKQAQEKAERSAETAQQEKEKATLAAQFAEQQRERATDATQYLILVMSNLDLSKSEIRNDKKLRNTLSELRQDLRKPENKRDSDFAYRLLPLAIVEVGSGLFDLALEDLALVESLLLGQNDTAAKNDLLQISLLRSRIHYERGEYAQVRDSLDKFESRVDDATPAEQKFAAKIMKLKCRIYDGVFDDVIQEMKKLLANVEQDQSLGGNSEIAAKIQFAIGEAHFSRRTYAPALNHFLEALQIFTSIDGPNSLDSLRCEMLALHCLAANCTEKQGLAQKRLDNFLVRVKEKFENDHVFAMGPQIMGATISKYSHKRREGAVEEFEQIIQQLSKQYGDDSLILAETRLQFAKVVTRINPNVSQEQTKLAEKTIVAKRGKNSIPYLNVQIQRLRSILHTQREGDPELVAAALQSAKETLELSKRLTGMHSIVTRELASQYAMAMGSSGSFRDAFEQLRSNLDDSRVDGDSVFTAETLQTMADGMLMSSKLKDSVPLLVKSLKVRTKTQGYLSIDSNSTFDRAKRYSKMLGDEANPDDLKYVKAWEKRQEEQIKRLTDILESNDWPYFVLEGDELLVRPWLGKPNEPKAPQPDESSHSTATPKPDESSNEGK